MSIVKTWPSVRTSLTQAQINSHWPPRLDPIDSKSSIKVLQGAAQEYVLEDGAGAIITSLSEAMKSDVNILLDQAVTSVEQTEVRSVEKML